ncbi:adenosylmethionine-8-amino-7-oxononanoate aminotransferase [Thalassobaculum fulvum]|uniref:Adenosylmethionine-8-amino-7-oxononanoate aminotransferase n=1 Tax=Thalassobaculum fulvum TaxID=1633335 RepID=A0A918XXF8_9PROT|nr:aspartate aminotransferase family protein [Thalassobaculum fulvum]GHD60459.1 adenosylmethionine-8-amino-7-oxononanoate aminotransferase [Thalassobaculum fulvum]
MSYVFNRDTRADMPIVVRGDGIWIEDSTGKRYIDASGGAAVSCLGHSHQRVIDAVREQVGKIAFAHTGAFSSEPAEALAEAVVTSAPGRMAKALFVSGGSEASEAAIKLARQYHVERGEPGRHRIIARRQSYHGNTLGALSASGNMARRALYQPYMQDWSHIAPCYPYRGRSHDETEEEYGLRVADELETEIERVGAETVSAFILEPVVGATLGAVAAVPGYLARVREICDRHGVLLIFDEVMCGMGRTGTLFASEHDGVVADIYTAAKGLGAGYQAIGAVIASEKVYGAIHDGSGFFQHGHTYMGHPVACAAALAVQTAIREEGLLGRVQAGGAKLRTMLEERFGNDAHVGEIRGRGYFLAMELVADRATKQPFDPSLAIHNRVKKAAMDLGLICYPMGGVIDGKSGDHVLVAPPFITSDDELAEIVSRVGQAVDRAIASTR